MAANKYHRLNEVLSSEQKEQIRKLMCFDPWDDNSKREYINSLAENLKKYEEEHK